MRVKRHESGLTLLELLVAVAIIGIIAVLAIPNLVNYFQQRRLTGAAEILYHDLHNARSEAIRQQDNVTVVFQGGGDWCYGVTTAASCDCSLAANCDLGRVSSTDYPEVSMEISGLNASGDNGSTVYSASRGAVSTTGYVQFTVEGKSTRVIINALGFPSICSVGNVAEYSTCS